VFDFSEGRAVVVLNQRYGVIDRAGKEIVPPTYLNASSLKNGFAKIKLGGNSNWSFIDMNGHLVGTDFYEKVGDFSEGLAPVSRNGKWGYINTDGELIAPLKFEEAYSFVEDLARVEIRDANGSDEQASEAEWNRIPPVLHVPEFPRERGKTVCSSNLINKELIEGCD